MNVTLIALPAKNLFVARTQVNKYLAASSQKLPAYLVFKLIAISDFLVANINHINDAHKAVYSKFATDKDGNIGVTDGGNGTLTYIIPDDRMDACQAELDVISNKTISIPESLAIHESFFERVKPGVIDYETMLAIAPFISVTITHAIN